MPVFPSVEWFEALQEVVNRDEKFKHFGTIDAKVGVRVDDKAYELVFEVYELVSVREISVDELEQCDFYLEQEPERWREMLENIKSHGKADISHTLNTIDLNSPQGLARGSDGYKVDLFYRYNQTLQDFFDSSARLETEFAIPAR
jgi:hypothetical protein